MAIAAFMDARIELNSVVVSTSSNKVSLPIQTETLETTTFGGGGWKANAGGLKSLQAGITFLNDYAAGALDATTYALLGTVVTLKVRATSGSITTSNPEYQGSVLVNEWTPFDASVGDLPEISVTWPSSGVFTRATS